METNFQRGGVLPKKKTQLNKKVNFGVQSFPKEKTKKHDDRKNKKSKNDNENSKEDLFSAKPLTLHSLINDMIVMGIVKAIHQTHILISLPGRLVGRVQITNVSKAYTSILQSMVEDQDLIKKPKMLSEMFTVGQIVYTKVLDKCHGEKEEIILSLLPSDVNSEITSASLVEGNTLQCAVGELEDHGYLMETGIENIKAFLPKSNIKTVLSNGEIIYCKVQGTPSPNTIILSAFKKNEMIKINTADVPNLKALFPGTVVDFNIVKVLKNGMEGLLFDGSVSAYANEMYVPTKLSVSDGSNIGKAVKARILYTMPLSNQIFVTLNVDEATNHKKEILFGTVVKNAKVLNQTSGGVVFKLDGNRKAFLPRRAIIKNLKNNFDAETALVKYSPNTQHDIRIMDYNEFEDCYLCTNNEKMLSEKYFSTYDLKIGDIIMAKIVEKFKSGIKISIGNIRGYLSGAFYHKISKIEPGKDIRVRVVEIDHDSKHIQVTNLSGFMKKENVRIMDDRSKIKVGESYTGLILKDTPRAFNILFFNHNKGQLFKTASFESDIISIGGLKENSVRNFEVASVKKDKILLRIPNIKITTNLGTVVDAKVSAVLPTSIQIFVDELKAFGKIPLEFISEISSYRELMLSAIKENTKLKVVAISNNQYSLRDVNYYSGEVKIDFNDVEVDDVLRCFVKSIDDENVLLDCPLKNFSQSIRLNRNAFNSSDDLSLTVGDVIYVNVIAKNESHNNSLYVTPELQKVWRNDSDALSMLENYLKDTNFLIQHLKESDKPLGKYAIGQRVSGKVKTIIGNNLLIELEDGVYAQGSVDNVPYKIGSEIREAVVVWIDPVNQMLFVTVRDKCKDEISIDQSANEKDVNSRKHKAIVVYFNEYVTVCTIRKAGGQPIVFVPSKHHYNDFSSSLNSRGLGNASSKLIIKRLREGKLLGTFIQDGKIFNKLEKLKTKLERKFVNKKRQHTDSISTMDDDEKKRPKVILDDDSENEQSEDEVDEEVTVVDEVKVASNTSKSLETFSKKNKELGKAFKSFIQQSKKGLGNVSNKDSLLDEKLVKLTSYKNSKGVSIGKKLQKPMLKSTIGMKTKKPKRLIKKK